MRNSTIILSFVLPLFHNKGNQNRGFKNEEIKIEKKKNRRIKIIIKPTKYCITIPFSLFKHYFNFAFIIYFKLKDIKGSKCER